MHNLSTVIRFEIVRTLKKKSFWLMALGFPLMMVVIFGIIFLSNKSTSDAVEQLKKQSFSIAITDESQLIKPAMLTAVNATVQTDRQKGIDAVVHGNIDGYIYYPADLTKQPIEIYGKDVGMFDNGRYGAVANALLLNSVQQDVNPNVRIVIEGAIKNTTKMFRDGKEYDQIKEMILPGVFIVLFYLLIGFFGGQMLTSTTEEKENRVIEMILTTIEARTLIIGKIISLVLLALIQGMVIILPALTGYLLFHDKLNMPTIDLSSLPVDWLRIGVGALVFGIGFMFFTGLLVLVGASVPTAKEAGQFLGIFMMLLFGPLYAATLFISNPHSALVTVLTVFPLTSPIPLLLRNAVGNLQTWELIAGLAALLLCSVVALTLAVRVFRYGALEYSRRLSLKDIFSLR